MVAGSGMPCVTSSTAAMPPSRPSSEPTDRSISPAMMTNAMPQATMPVTAICRIRFERLRGEVKPPSVFQLKKAQMMAIAIRSARILYCVNSCLRLVVCMGSLYSGFNA